MGEFPLSLFNFMAQFFALSDDTVCQWIQYIQILLKVHFLLHFLLGHFYELSCLFSLSLVGRFSRSVHFVIGRPRNNTQKHVLFLSLWYHRCYYLYVAIVLAVVDIVLDAVDLKLDAEYRYRCQIEHDLI